MVKIQHRIDDHALFGRRIPHKITHRVGGPVEERPYLRFCSGGHRASLSSSSTLTYILALPNLATSNLWRRRSCLCKRCGDPSLRPILASPILSARRAKQPDYSSCWPTRTVC